LPTGLIAPSIKIQLNSLMAAFAKQLCFADKKLSVVDTQMSFLFEAAAPRAAYLRGALESEAEASPSPKGHRLLPLDLLAVGANVAPILCRIISV